MTETLLFFVAVLVASVVVMWCERNRLERQIASLLEELAAERSTVSRQMIELAEVNADKIRDAKHFSSLQKELDEIEKQRDQAKNDFDFIQISFWEEAETSFHLRNSRAIITKCCRKLKRELSQARSAHKLTIDAAHDMIDEMKKERDHARKLMDETRERCGAEIDVLEDTIRDLGREKNMAEKRINQLLAENKRQAISGKNLRQSRQKITEHCRLLKRKHKKLMAFFDYILDELATINTAGKP